MNQGPYEALITWFARNSVAANLLMVILLTLVVMPGAATVVGILVWRRRRH